MKLFFELAAFKASAMPHLCDKTQRRISLFYRKFLGEKN